LTASIGVDGVADSARGGQKAMAIRISRGPVLGSVAWPLKIRPKCSPAAHAAAAATIAMTRAALAVAGNRTPAAASANAAVNAMMMISAPPPPAEVSEEAPLGAASMRQARPPHRTTQASVA